MKYDIIEFPEALKCWLRKCRPIISLDTETTSLQYTDLELVGISLCDGKQACYIPVNKHWDKTWALLGFWLEEFVDMVVMHNAPFDMKVLYKYGVDLRNVFCTQTASFLLDESRQSHSLKHLAHTILRIPKEQIKEYTEVENADFITFSRYAINDAVWTWGLFEKFFQEIEKQGLHHLFYEIEMPFQRALRDLAINGILVDPAAADQTRAEIQHLYCKLEDKLFKYVYTNLWERTDPYWGNWYFTITPRSREVKLEQHINFSSSDQMIPIIESLGIEIKEKTAKGNKSIGKVFKNRVKGTHPFIDMWITYGQVEKLLNSFLNPFKSHIQSDGRIHASFNNTVAVTGRLCVHPSTLIEVPRDLNEWPGGKPLYKLKKGDWVYSFDEDRELCLKQVQWVGPTKTKPTLIIHTDKGLPLTVSRDHLIRKWRGEWVHAKDLKIGDRLLCMPLRGNHGDHTIFFPHSRNRGEGSKGGGRVYEHRFVYSQVTGEQLGSKAIIHHKDKNPWNNSISNLQRVKNAGHHRKIHRDLTQNHKVVRIEEGEPEQLWDLEIEDTHCFIGNDIALHNSCSNPNLEQLPQNNDIANIRNLFIAPEGKVLLAADYSQQELRVLAEETGDKNLKQAYIDGVDVHQTVADQVGCSRKEAKTVGFGIAYGKTVYGFAKDFNCSKAEAQKILDIFLKKYPAISTRMERNRMQINKYGYCKNMSGRRRRFPDFHKMNKWGKERAYRQGFNFLIQSFSADMLKIAAAQAVLNPKLRLVNLIHDELVFEADKDYAEEAIKYIHEIMVNAVKLSIPLEAEIKMGYRYGEAKT